MQIDITKAKALQCVKEIFEPILPDSAVNLLHRISLMPPPTESKNPKKIDFDDLFMELTQHWLDVNATWKQHLTVLFDMLCDNYSVVEEMKFVVGDVHPEVDDE